MKTIWKFQVPVKDYFVLKMPKGSAVLSVGMQHEHPVLWAIVDPDEDLEDKPFGLFGTGHPMDSEPDLEFIGTVQMPNGLVWHVFEEL